MNEKKARRLYFCGFSFPSISDDELLKSARTLSRTKIVFEGKELPYPENMTYLAEYVSGTVETVVVIDDECVIESSDEGDGLYANAQYCFKDVERARFLVFTNVALSMKSDSFGFKMKEITSKEEMPEWLGEYYFKVLTDIKKKEST
jgi:hypothetical protein